MGLILSTEEANERNVVLNGMISKKQNILKIDPWDNNVSQRRFDSFKGFRNRIINYKDINFYIDFKEGYSGSGEYPPTITIFMLYSFN